MGERNQDKPRRRRQQQIRAAHGPLVPAGESDRGKREKHNDCPGPAGRRCDVRSERELAEPWSHRHESP